MNEELLFDLINRDIDGLLEEAEGRALQEELRRNPEARKLHGELQAMSKRLSTFDDLEPPVDFHKSVMRSLPGDVVQRRNAVKSAAAEGGFSRMLKSFFSAPWRPALVGAAAVVLIVVLMNPGGDMPPSDGTMPGTMIEQLETVNAGAVDNLISCKLQQGDELLVLELELLDAASGDIQLEFDAQVVQPRNADANAGRLALHLERGAARRLEFELQSDDIARFQVQGSVDGQTVDLTLSNR